MIEKRKRNDLTNGDRRLITKLSRQSPLLSQSELANRFTQTTGKNIVQSTVARILKGKEKWLDEDLGLQAKRKRARYGGFPQLDAALWEWFLTRQTQTALTGDILRVKAQQLSALIYTED